MKKIIDGKRYDTDAAKAAASYSKESPRDLDYICETLYVKKTGEMFLHGEGGPRTRYAVSTGSNSWAGGERIIPIGTENAKQWAAEHLSGETYESIFGAVAEDGEPVAVSYRIRPDLADKLKRAALTQGKTQREVLENLLDQLDG